MAAVNRRKCCCGTTGPIPFTTSYCFRVRGIVVPGGCIQWWNGFLSRTTPNGHAGRINLRTGVAGAGFTWSTGAPGDGLLPFRPPNWPPPEGHKNAPNSTLEFCNFATGQIFRRALYVGLGISVVTENATTRTYRYTFALGDWNTYRPDGGFFFGSTDVVAPLTGGVAVLPPLMTVANTFASAQPPNGPAGGGGFVDLVPVPPHDGSPPTGACDAYTLSVSDADQSGVQPPPAPPNLNGDYLVTRIGPGQWTGEASLTGSAWYWHANVSGAQWIQPRVAGDIGPRPNGWITLRAAVANYNGPGSYRDLTTRLRVTCAAGTPPPQAGNPCDRCPGLCTGCCVTFAATIAGADPLLVGTTNVRRDTGTNACAYQSVQGAPVAIEIACDPNDGWRAVASREGATLEFRNPQSAGVTACTPTHNWVPADGSDATLVLTCIEQPAGGAPAGGLNPAQPDSAGGGGCGCGASDYREGPTSGCNPTLSKCKPRSRAIEG